MTYVDNLNAVNRILKVERVSASVVTVLWILLAENNEHREEGWFEITDEAIRSRVSQLSKAQVTAAKRRLKELGVINYEAESRAPRRGTRYVVTLSKTGAKIGAKSGAKLGVKQKNPINACVKREESKEKEKETNKEKEVVDFEAYASSTASLEAEYAGLVKARVDSEPEAKAEVKPEELPIETSLEAKAEVKPEEVPIEASLEAKAEVAPEEVPVETSLEAKAEVKPEELLVEASLESSVEVMTAKETPPASAQVLTISDCVAGGAASENRLKGKPPLEPDWLSYMNGGKEYDDRLNGVISKTPGRACG